MEQNENILLSSYARGGGCGCKIAPAVLQEIIAKVKVAPTGNLISGNSHHEDAAVWDLGGGDCLISTTDFFMPVVDDAYDFGAISAANALSDVYAMGGSPFMALSVLGWPVEKLPAALAARVLEGAADVCREAGVVLAGGHSIDSAEPFFGLSVNGRVMKNRVKRNNTVTEGDYLYLTKPLGTGILTTALKRRLIVEAEHYPQLVAWMKKLNRVGTSLSMVEGVNALTDVTGFGLAGHLLEMLESSNCSAELWADKIPLMQGVETCLSSFIYPDMTMRNFNAISTHCTELDGRNLLILCDPQTSGGLLISVAAEARTEVEKLLVADGSKVSCIGRLVKQQDKRIFVSS
ncbi:MAG: selenide, water dikinase SelD [Bacteroidia bacterium]